MRLWSAPASAVQVIRGRFVVVAGWMTVTTGDGGFSLVLTKKNAHLEPGVFTPRAGKHAGKPDQMQATAEKKRIQASNGLSGVVQAIAGHLTAAFR